ncbi:transglutaminase-like domain-containing protein [Actinotalea sp. Marseille-Q4924]|uniref:transglutaminase-like domain-containing protein n=1 Tax=Actinotalea sp. Marseille-Q4924 TaxID=2866571 RepID=UPI001CE406BE|nr:transglutaminase-like domain-containing protein [Actinotalea sp. Marseille-Q4924]
MTAPAVVLEAQGRAPRARPAVDAGVLAVAQVLVLLPLVPVYGWRAALPAVLGGVAAGTALAVVAAARRWSGPVTAALAVVGYLLVGPALAAPTTTLWGVLPTPAGALLLLRGAITVWREVLTLDPSLGGSGNLLAAPFLLAYGGTVVGVTLARRLDARAGAGAAAVPLVTLLVALLLGTKEAVQPVLAGTALALVLLSWVAWRRGSLAPRRVVSAAVLVAVAVAGGAVVGPVVGQDRPRFVLRDEIVPPFDPRDQASPLSSFRRFVKDWRETELVTVRGLPEGAAVRIATMDAFDGVVWDVAGSEAAEGSGRFRRVGETIQATERGEQATVEVEVHTLPGVWLPTVGYAERIDFTGPEPLERAADLRYNDATGTAVLTDGVPDGTRFTAQVVVPPALAPDELGGAAVGAVRLPEPRAVPEAVPLLAGEIAGTASTPALVAEALAAGLRERGWFSHGLVESGDHPSLSGHGADRLTTLLTGDLMVGDGEQYASAMALMAREMGLPSRVVLGLVPGEDQAGAEEVTLTGDDVEAWVEIAFAGHGWVAFDATPDESKTPREDTPDQEAQPQPQVRQPPPPPPDPVTPPDDDTEQPRTDAPPEPRTGVDDLRPYLVAAAVVAVPLLVLLGPLLLVGALKVRRRRRRRTTGGPVERVVGGWDELLDHAHDLRRPAPRRATRRETAVHLAESFAAAVPEQRTPVGATRGPAGPSRRRPGVAGPVAGLAARADAVVFGPGEPTREQVEAYWQQVDAALRSLQAAVPARDRVRARWSTASLRARRRERTAARRARPVDGAPGG